MPPDDDAADAADDAATRALAAALRRAYDARDRAAADAADLRARVEHLTALADAHGVGGDGRRRLLDKLGAAARAQLAPTVRLRVYVDKYAQPGTDIDCAARLPLCHARCCSFSFELTTQDLDEGAVRWEPEAPYVILHERDGYCTHFDRAAGGGCTIYAQRPAACRAYDCRADPRVWLDFDARIPAPMPAALTPPATKKRADVGT
jgi:Putative zinc- or iron-chelating domain